MTTCPSLSNVELANNSFINKLRNLEPAGTKVSIYYLQNKVPCTFSCSATLRFSSPTQGRNLKTNKLFLFPPCTECAWHPRNWQRWTRRCWYFRRVCPSPSQPAQADAGVGCLRQLKAGSPVGRCGFSSPLQGYFWDQAQSYKKWNQHSTEVNNSHCLDGTG